MPTVQFMSKDDVHEVKTPAFVIRVRQPGIAYADLPPHHLGSITVNVMTDSLIDPDTCEQIITLAEQAEAANADIVVHCNEGKYRSRMIANFIWRFFDEYDHVGKDFLGGEMRDLNYKSLYNHYKATRKEKRA